MNGSSVLSPLEERVDVWTISLVEPCEIVLSPAEILRANRFRSARHQLHWSRAHSALRRILAQSLETEPLAISFCVNEHGKPSTSGIQFNLSHTDDFAMIAVTSRAEVGIDIERLRPGLRIEHLLARLHEENLPDDIEGLYRRWTRREAISKARGGALFDAPDPRVQTVDLMAPEGHFASLALVGAIPRIRYCTGAGLR